MCSPSCQVWSTDPPVERADAPDSVGRGPAAPTGPDCGVGAGGHSRDAAPLPAGVGSRVLTPAASARRSASRAGSGAGVAGAAVEVGEPSCLGDSGGAVLASVALAEERASRPAVGEGAADAVAAGVGPAVPWLAGARSLPLACGESGASAVGVVAAGSGFVRLQPARSMAAVARRATTVAAAGSVTRVRW